MGNRDHTRHRNLRKYLLGSNLQTIHPGVIEMQLVDKEFAVEFAIAEEELIEDFLDDMLTGSEIDGFISHFMVTRERQTELWLIRNLRLASQN